MPQLITLRLKFSQRREQNLTTKKNGTQPSQYLEIVLMDQFCCKSSQKSYTIAINNITSVTIFSYKKNWCTAVKTIRNHAVLFGSCCRMTFVTNQLNRNSSILLKLSKNWYLGRKSTCLQHYICHKSSQKKSHKYYHFYRIKLEYITRFPSNLYTGLFFLDLKKKLNIQTSTCQWTLTYFINFHKVAPKSFNLKW